MLDRYGVRAWLYHGQENHGDVFTAIVDRLKRSGAEEVEARAGFTLDFEDGTSIEVLHPQSRPAITDRLGDHAMVLRVTYGDVSFLLTSDLSSAGQRDMMARGVSPAAAVMQIPQHGAARALDDEFLALVQPQVVLLQTDIANRRDDPDPDTIAKVEGWRVFPYGRNGYDSSPDGWRQP